MGSLPDVVSAGRGTGVSLGWFCKSLPCDFCVGSRLVFCGLLSCSVRRVRIPGIRAAADTVTEGGVSPRLTRSGEEISGGGDDGGGDDGGGGEPGCELFAVSRSIPTRYSLPSLRQFRAMPVNHSKRHWMLSFDPTPIGLLSRIHAPWADLTSMHAEAVCMAPASSCHDASTMVITAARGSRIGPPMAESIGTRTN
jgi:hypothetical protein